MTNIRLLPVVILAIAALLVLKTIGLVTNGGYVLTGVSVAEAAGGGGGSGGGSSSGSTAGSTAGTTKSDATITPAGEPTMQDTSPTLADPAPTLGAQGAEASGGYGAAAADAPAAVEGGEGAAPAAETAKASAPALGNFCFEADATLTEGGEVILNAEPASGGEGAAATSETATATPAAEGEAATAPTGSFAANMAIDCLPSGDAVPTEITADGKTVALDATSQTQQQLLERLAARRAELEQYEQDLALRTSIVDAAEKRIEERAATLQALETQISGLVDQRTEMETGQFAGIVAMYEAMKPKDAANIFNNLDMDVLLRVAKTMSPRKMAPILAAMNAPRAQELTVAMAALADKPATEMTPQDLAALPQIVGQ